MLFCLLLSSVGVPALAQVEDGATYLYSSNQPSTTLDVGMLYSFTPRFTELGGLPLQFQIVNLPTWASFNEIDGVLSGVPALADAGVYSGIKICVSDGSLQSCMPEFSITVNVPAPQLTPRPSYSASLSWIAPTQNNDGTALVDLAGFTVYSGPTPDQLTPVASIPSASFTSLDIRGLGPGEHYFAVKALNAQGIESDFSEVVYKAF